MTPLFEDWFGGTSAPYGRMVWYIAYILPRPMFRSTVEAHYLNECISPCERGG